MKDEQHDENELTVIGEGSDTRLSTRTNFPLSPGARSNTDLKADEFEPSQENKQRIAAQIISEGQIRRERQIALALTNQIEELERRRTISLQALADEINKVSGIERKLNAIRAGKWAMDRDAQIIFDPDTLLESPPPLPESGPASENQPGVDLSKLSTYDEGGRPKLGYRSK